MIRKNQVAPKIASGLVSNTVTFQVENGQPIWVYAVIFCKDDTTTTTNNISMETGDGTEVLFLMSNAGARSYYLDIPFKAHKGLRFQAENSTTKRVTVFYMGPGI